MGFGARRVKKDTMFQFCQTVMSRFMVRFFYVNEWSQDTWVTEVRFSGANGAWKGVYFNSIYGHAYYSRITEATGTGANGRTSVTIP